tara:strand:- start:319 stop:546 length:228 start_codon:yes stop_codon:yes gene_type:complete
MKKAINYFKKHPKITALFIALHVPLFVTLYGLLIGTIVFLVLLMIFMKQLLPRYIKTDIDRSKFKSKNSPRISIR